MDVLSSDAETGILSAAAKLLDQCCFDSRSKNTAVQRIPIAALTANMDRSLLLDPNLNNPAIVVIIRSKHTHIHNFPQSLSLYPSLISRFSFPSRTVVATRHKPLYLSLAAPS